MSDKKLNEKKKKLLELTESDTHMTFSFKLDWFNKFFFILPELSYLLIQFS